MPSLTNEASLTALDCDQTVTDRKVGLWGLCICSGDADGPGVPWEGGGGPRGLTVAAGRNRNGVEGNAEAKER